MGENYKLLYEQMKKMVAMYQDEIVPGLRKNIEEMERNRVEVVRCEDCKWSVMDAPDFPYQYLCSLEGGFWNKGSHFCSYGERKEKGDG